jgi:hypothetical protein
MSNRTRHSRRRDDSEPSGDTILDVPVRLAARIEVPVEEGWTRLTVSQARRARLADHFSDELVRAGGVFAICGPARSAKSETALGLCDLRQLRAVYATSGDAVRAAFQPRRNVCVIIDPVSSYDIDLVAECIDFYRGTSPIIIVDRQREVLEDPRVSPDVLFVMGLPSANAITDHLRYVLNEYRTDLDDSDFQTIGERMGPANAEHPEALGMALHEVNMVANDAALACYQAAEPVTAAAFGKAIAEFADVRAGRSSQGATA